MKQLAIVCGVICLLFSGCSKEVSVEPQTRTVFAMDTIMNLTVYTESETLMDEASGRITDLENKLSVTLEGSEIHTLNTEGTSFLSEDTRALMKTALELCDSTDGALDISIYPLVTAWGFTTGEYRIPDDAELKELLDKVDYTAVELDGSNALIHNGMKIDLGSVAKGYTGDVIYGLLRDSGVTSALLSLGGNVHALGSKPDGTDWRVAVQHPTKEDYLGVLSISDVAAITSGGYERYFVGDDGATYWHIIDPATGSPVDSGLISVTIVGKNGLVCDGLSTALFVMGLEDATEYWRSGEQEFEAIFVTEDEDVYITEGLQERFTLAQAYANLNLTVITQ